jgi:hypothetical protein
MPPEITEKKNTEEVIQVTLETNTVEIDEETVLFRHDKTFFLPAGIAIELKISEGPAPHHKR